MPNPRPAHTIELTIGHVLTDSQFEELEDLTFLHFEGDAEAWPISLKIVSEFNQTTFIPAPPPIPASPSSSMSSTGSRPPSDSGSPPPPASGGGDDLEPVVNKKTTTISVAVSREWDPASEEAVRTIVRNILMEIMGGGITVKRS
ncbi:hypothetical protein I350_07459 [Cryptococcus amylolentus CBS 6273]|uniref:Uncharacterized protein n=1 Tax=Cryptococcus amylolentus CBS 6273 TaxID=1296118 RepID=A0A1E3JEJ1_9TREE|nr:hypothetical protein I350_07459 [Cryptococcus amylolentus CBS 6273]